MKTEPKHWVRKQTANRIIHALDDFVEAAERVIEADAQLQREAAELVKKKKIKKAKKGK